MEKKKGSNVKNILFIFVASLVILFCYIFVSIKIIGRDYVDVFGYTCFEVDSGSMSPTIIRGDVVVVKINGKYRKNDIITYKFHNNFITHRVVDINEDKIIMRGDANNVDDKIINRKMVIGKVVFIMKRVGVWKKVFGSSGVVISFIITIIMFCLLFSYKEKFVRFRMRKIHYVKKKKKRTVKKKGKKV